MEQFVKEYSWEDTLSGGQTIGERPRGATREGTARLAWCNGTVECANSDPHGERLTERVAETRNTSIRLSCGRSTPFSERCSLLLSAAGRSWPLLGAALFAAAGRRAVGRCWALLGAALLAAAGR